MAFIENYREAPGAKNGKLLARIACQLSEGAARHLYGKFPGDYVRAAVQLSDEEQEKLYDRFPGLRKRVRKAEEEQLKPAAKPPP